MVLTISGWAKEQTRFSRLNIKKALEGSWHNWTHLREGESAICDEFTSWKEPAVLILVWFFRLCCRCWCQQTLTFLVALSFEPLAIKYPGDLTLFFIHLPNNKQIMIDFEPTTSLFKVQFESIELRRQLNCSEAEETGMREAGKREG